MRDASRRPASDMLVWGVPFALLLHNIEEALTFARYLPRVHAAAPVPLRAMLPERLHIAYAGLLVVTVIPFGLAVLARRPKSPGWVRYALLVVAASLLANVAWHLMVAVALRGYAPGVLTAVAVNLPVTLAALRGARRDGWLSRRGLWLVLLLAVLFHGPGLIGIVALVSLRS